MGLRVGYEQIGGDNSFMIVKQQIASQLYEDYYKSELKNVQMDERIENDEKYGVPHMNNIFYGLYGKRKVIPSLTLYMEEYLKKWVMPNPYKNSMNGLWIGGYTFRSKIRKHHYAFNMPPLLRKLSLTYMSFLKETYVIHWFYDKGLKNAYWSSEADLDLGIDIMVKNPKDDQYGVKVYSDTNRAKTFAKIKDNSRHAETKGISTIAIPVSLNGPRLGDTYVPSDNILMCMYKLIINGVKTKTFTEDINGQLIIEPGIILGGTHGCC